MVRLNEIIVFISDNSIEQSNKNGCNLTGCWSCKFLSLMWFVCYHVFLCAVFVVCHSCIDCICCVCCCRWRNK